MTLETLEARAQKGEDEQRIRCVCVRVCMQV